MVYCLGYGVLFVFLSECVGIVGGSNMGYMKEANKEWYTCSVACTRRPCQKDTSLIFYKIDYKDVPVGVPCCGCGDNLKEI